MGLSKDIVGESNVFEMTPIMGGEDFAYYLQKVPGAFFFVGVWKSRNQCNISSPSSEV